MIQCVQSIYTVWSQPPIVAQYFSCAESGRKWIERERVGVVERREKYKRRGGGRERKGTREKEERGGGGQ